MFQGYACALVQWHLVNNTPPLATRHLIQDKNKKMQSKTIRQTTLFLCLLLSTFLHSQITIEYPENLTVECGADITPTPDNEIVGYPNVSTSCTSGLTDISFSDNIDRLVDCSGTGILLRFWTVSDNCGGFQTLLQRITIEDTTPPEINCMADVIIECNASLNPAENPDLAFPEVIDCSEGGDLTISYTDRNEGEGFCDNLPELVLRTWTVTDACGNESTCLQTIRVGKDPLLVFCDIEDYEHECNGLDGSRFAAESWDLSNTNQLRNCTQTDCGPAEIISDFDYGRIDGPCGITGSFEVNYLIKDNCGNSKFKTVSFTLRDTTPPESFCNPIDFGVSCEGDETAASRVEGWHTENLTLLETCLFDNCGDVTVSSDFNPSNFTIGTLNFDCNDDTGFTVNYTLTDQCGNTTVKTAFLKVVDNAAPTFENVPRDTSIGANDNLPVEEPTIVDNCSTNLTAQFSEERIENENDNGYQLIRTWTTTDDCGNESTATQRVIVLDPILSLACTSAEVNIEGDKIIVSNLLAPNEIVKVFAADNRVVYNCFRNCGEVQTTRPLAEDTYTVDIQFYTANWRLICTDEREIVIGNDSGNNDEEGNVDNGENNNDENDDPCTTVDCEQVPPAINNLPPDMTVSSDAVPPVPSLTATDNCDTDVNLTFAESRMDDANSNDYVLSRVWTAVDDCGNIFTGEQVIRVEVNDDSNNNNDGNDDDDENTDGDENSTPCSGNDCETTPPIIANIPSDETVNYDAVPSPAQPIATDNCDTDVALTLEEVISESTDTRNYTLTRIWTATDDCGNESTRQQIIIVEGDLNTGNEEEEENNNNPDENNNIDTSICSDVIITTGQFTFNFSNLNAPNKIVKIFDENYNVVLECVENCGTEVLFSYETFGTYFADVQLYTSDWAFICETRQTVELKDMRTDNGGNGNTTLCEEIEISVDTNAINVNNINSANKIVKLFDENYDIISECANDCETPTSFTPPAGNYFVDVQLYTDDWVFICEVQEQVSTSATDSEGNGNGNNEEHQSDNPCDNVQINGTESSINLSNFSTANKIVNIFDEDYNQIYNCFTECPSEVNVSISELGTYLVEVQLYDIEWNLICLQRTSIDVTQDSQTASNNSKNDKEANSNNSTTILNTTSRFADNITVPIEFSIYPNPASNEVILNLSKVKGAQLNFRIYNQLASIVKEGKIDIANGTLFKLNLQDIENGLYLVHIQAKGQAPVTKKLLVNR